MSHSLKLCWLGIIFKNGLLLFSLQSLTVSRKKLVHYTSYEQKKRANDAVLIGAFAVNIFSLLHLFLCSSLFHMPQNQQ